MKFKLSKQASQDIEDIYLYGLINFGEPWADEYSNNMPSCIDLICNNPEIGRLDSRTNPAIRRFDFESHVMFYDINDQSIFIVRISHRSVDYVTHLST